MPVLHTVQISFHAVDVNKYRYIQTPIGILIFEVIGHVYTEQCEVLSASKYLHPFLGRIINYYVYHAEKHFSL